MSSTLNSNPATGGATSVSGMNPKTTSSSPGRKSSAEPFDKSTADLGGASGGLGKAATISTKFTEMFGLEYPIMGAPMFLTSNIPMVTAMGDAGGLGTIPALNFRPMEKFEEALKELTSRPNRKPIGVNIIVQKQNKAADQHLDLCLKYGVDLLISSLGSPKDLIARAKGTKTKVFCDVVGLTHAQKCADYGADGLIAVGAGAGGHSGDISLFALIPYLRHKIQLPIVAAGSIGDGKGLVAAMALGADAVYMGTRLIASRECGVDPAYKQAILNAGCEQIVNTHRVDGFPGNFIKTPSLEKIGLENNLVEDVVSHSDKLKRFIALGRAARSLMSQKTGQKASYKTVFSAGHGVGNIEEILSIETIVQNTIKEYHAIVRSLAP